jgi:hypothetical protein
VQGQVKVRRTLSQCHVEDIALLITDYFQASITKASSHGCLYKSPKVGYQILPNMLLLLSSTEHFYISTSTSMQLKYKDIKNSTVFKHNMCLITEANVKQQGLPIDICCSLFWSHRHSRRERAALREREGFEH